MATPTLIYIGDDHDVTYHGAQKASDSTYLNNGTCTWQLKDSAGTVLASGAAAYTAASNGNYDGVVQSTDTAGLTEGGRYYLEITFAHAASGCDDFRRIPLRAAYRTGN